MSVAVRTPRMLDAGPFVGEAGGRVPDPRSGLNEDGEWVPAFESQRRAFEPGNELARTHGAYSERELAPLQEEIFQRLRREARNPNPALDHARWLLAGRLAQIEVARRWIGEKGLLNEQGELWPIVRELPKWESRSRELMRELAMTDLSAAELGRDLAETHVALAEVEALFTATLEVSSRYIAHADREAWMRDVKAAGTGILEASAAPVSDTVDDIE